VNAVLYFFTGLSAVGGLSGVASFFLWRANSKKLNSEGRKLDIEGDVLMSDKALEMYEAMSKRATAAENKADAADQKASKCIEGTYELIDHIYTLRRLMAEHNIEPPPFRFPSSITGVGVA
jgi:hypothetical protein